MKTSPSVLTLLLLATLSAAAVSAQSPEPSGVQKVQMINAARTDLYAQLAREIKGLNISDKSVVANAVNLEMIRTGFVEALVKGVKEGEPYFVGDICIVDGSITLDQVVENLKRVSTTADGKPVQNFEGIKRYNSTSVVKAQGAGTLPAERTEETVGGPEDSGLAEAFAKLEGPGQHKLNAKNAAEMDGYAGLAKQLKGLSIDDRTTIFNSAQARWTEATASALVKGARVKRYFARGKDLLGCEMEITLQQIVENIQKHSTIFSNGDEVTTEKIRRMNGDLVTVTALGYGALGNQQIRSSSSGIVGSVQ